MGISTSGHGWSCWRNSSHRGRSEPRLIAALLKCSLQEAERLAGGNVALPSDEDLVVGLRSRLGTEYDEAPVRLTSLVLPREFKPLNNGSPFVDQFLSYLRYRGYKTTQLDWLIKTYSLQYTTSGKFAYRIIIPIYDRWRELQTWTGRTILEDEEVRYKTLRKEQQLCSPKETLLGLPLLWDCSNPKVLLVCEGPFDAFWITAFGRAFGVYATCLFGLSMSPQQAELLLGLQERFARMAILLDAAASFQAFKLSNSGLNLGTVRLPDSVKDPAELPAANVMELCTDLLSGV